MGKRICRYFERRQEFNDADPVRRIGKADIFEKRHPVRSKGRMRRCREVRIRRSVALNILAHAEFAAAIELVVEVLLLDYLNATFLKTAFAPVMVPPNDTF